MHEFWRSAVFSISLPELFFTAKIHGNELIFLARNKAAVHRHSRRARCTAVAPWATIRRRLLAIVVVPYRRRGGQVHCPPLGRGRPPSRPPAAGWSRWGARGERYCSAWGMKFSWLYRTRRGVQKSHEYDRLLQKGQPYITRIKKYREAMMSLQTKYTVRAE